MAFKGLRDEFPMLSKWTHFNCGGMAPLSNQVGAELLRVPQAVIEDGPGLLLAHDEEFLGIETARATIARVIGADPSEITFTTQFATGVNIVIEGMDWREGDEIIVTNQEHPALLIPLMNIVERHNLVVHRIPWSHDQDEMLRSYNAVLSDSTKLVAVSHITTDSGTILPVHEMTRLAHNHGAKVLFDGAHSVGQIPIDVHELECDFYAIVGYKWLLGPYPSAALYIKSSVLDEVSVTWTGSNATVSGSVTMGPEDLEWVEGGRRFEYGGRTYSYDTAMATGASQIENLGIDNILTHSRQLMGYFVDGLNRVPGATVHGPEPATGTGITAISLENMDGRKLSEILKEHYRVIQRPALWGSAVRISLACFIDERDVDYLLDSLVTIVKND